MHLPSIGSLHADRDIPEWLVSAPVPIPYFDGLPLTFTLTGAGKGDAGEFNEAVAGFLNLGLADRQGAAPYVFKNYLEMADLVDEEDLHCSIPEADKVWEYVTPTQIYVTRRFRRDELVYVQITAECEWEPVHGLQIVYRRGTELSRVSCQDGHLSHAEAYGLPDEQDKIA